MDVQSKPVILLDVHLEDLRAILLDKGWNVKTVTKEFGDSPEARSDENIFRYAKENKKCVVVTDDDDLVQRLKAEDLHVITIETADRAQIVHEKLKKKLSSPHKLCQS